MLQLIYNLQINSFIIMKKAILYAVLSLGLNLATAQSGTQTKHEMNVDNKIQQLEAIVGPLSDAQKVQVKAVKDEQHKERQSHKAEGRDAQKKSMQKYREEHKGALKKILTPDQFAKLRAVTKEEKQSKKIK